MRNEHFNWMSKLSTLVEAKKYDDVLSMVKGEATSQQHLINSLRQDFINQQVVVC